MDGWSILKIVAPSPPTLKEQRIQTELHNVELFDHINKKMSFIEQFHISAVVFSLTIYLLNFLLLDQTD